MIVAARFMKIPFLELKPTYDELRDELDSAYHRVMDSGWYLLGNEIESFEAGFAKYCEAKHCVAVGNGLDALHLTLRAYDILNNVITVYTGTASLSGTGQGGPLPHATGQSGRVRGSDR